MYVCLDQYKQQEKDQSQQVARYRIKGDNNKHLNALFALQNLIRLLLASDTCQSVGQFIRPLLPTCSDAKIQV